jgi:hypothetical protein
MLSQLKNYWKVLEFMWNKRVPKKNLQNILKACIL